MQSAASEGNYVGFNVGSAYERGGSPLIEGLGDGTVSVGADLETLLETYGALVETGFSQARAGLEPTEIVDAALALVDAHGAEALTMRRLAADLGVTTTTIYDGLVTIVKKSYPNGSPVTVFTTTRNLIGEVVSVVRPVPVESRF